MAGQWLDNPFKEVSLDRLSKFYRIQIILLIGRWRRITMLSKIKNSIRIANGRITLEAEVLDIIGTNKS